MMIRRNAVHSKDSATAIGIILGPGGLHAPVTESVPDWNTVAPAPESLRGVQCWAAKRRQSRSTGSFYPALWSALLGCEASPVSEHGLILPRVVSLWSGVKFLFNFIEARNHCLT